jgi:hypothetical protein
MAYYRSSRINFRLNGQILNCRELGKLIGADDNSIRSRVYAMGYTSGKDTEPVTIDLTDESKEMFKRERGGGGHVQTICPMCDNATRNGCPWARSFQPVDGWDAKPTKLLVHHNREEKNWIMDSFLVRDCPLFDSTNINEQFRPDMIDRNEQEWKEFLVRLISWEVRDYAQSLVRIRNNPKAAEEYRTNPNRVKLSGDSFIVKEECEAFFRSDLFENILEYLKIDRFSGEQFIEAVQEDPDKFARRESEFGGQD